MCTLYPRHRLTDWWLSATPNTHTEITSGSTSRNGGEKLGEHCSFLICFILCCVGCYTENVFLYCLCLKTKGTDAILMGTRDITSHNTPTASRKNSLAAAAHTSLAQREAEVTSPWGERIIGFMLQPHLLSINFHAKCLCLLFITVHSSVCQFNFRLLCRYPQ